MKYKITKTDGTPVNPSARYFVLRLDDPTRPDNQAARAALAIYAREAHDVAPGAAQAAMEALEETARKQAHEAAIYMRPSRGLADS